MFRTFILIVCTVLMPLFVGAQTKTIEGYVFQSGNRGYLQSVKVELKSVANDEVLDTDFTNKDGFFSFEINEIQAYKVSVLKDMYESQEISVPVSDIRAEDKTFLSIKMERSPGYQFEITLAPKRDDENIPIDAVNGALIEVYNNTTREAVMELKEHPDPHFEVDLLKGNHYTILVRKEGFLAKRMEAFVDVEGCILCFEGIGSVTPGVADNLTGQNQMGVLLANVELDRAFSGKKMEVQDIYYDFGSSKLRQEAFKELDNVAILIKDNPEITVELGSHTDSRGKADKNQLLSLERAKSAVRYLIEEGGVASRNIIARGYGESNIKNGCVDGVECSEAKHQENRRTELKITGIMATPPEPVPLARMKQLENMDDIIAELQNEGQVRLTEGQTIDEIIKQTEQPKRVETPKPKEEDVNKAIDQIFAEAESTINQQEIIKEELDKKPVFVEKEIKQPQFVDTMDSTPNETNDNPYAFIDGPKIVIMESENILQTDHPIFDKHEQIFQFMNGDKVLYMIGDFTDMTKAKGFLGTTKMMYPEAYILVFNKGVIVN